MRKKCSINGCENLSSAKGFCNMHYLRVKKYGDPLITKTERNGMQPAHKLEYCSWTAMKYRCSNSNSCNYKYYGGRGITVCEKWKKSFTAFYNDMGPKPFSKAQIDRIDNDGNYEPNNCHWVSNLENARNKSTTKLNHKQVLEIKKLRAEGITLRQIAVKYNVDYTNIYKIDSRQTWKDVV